MNFLLNRVLLGSTLTIASLFTNSAIAAPHEVRLDSMTAEFESITQDIDVSPNPEDLIAPEIVQEVQSELVADASISSFGQESYHLDSLISTPGSEDAAQVTSVSQLSDVQPTDWAFQALQSLVERYGCIAGYPDGTFRGNRSATRYELAAALNACLDNISDKFATKEDLEAVKALQEEFQAELAILRGRVDGLEARTDTLEAQQFSTTTKLNGEVIIALSGFLDGDNQGDGGADLESRPRLTGRARLNFLTSFTGKDLLYTRLQASNQAINFGGTAGNGFADQTGTPMSRLSFDTGDTNSLVALDRLTYKFPLGKKTTVTVQANNGFHHYTATTTNPYYEGGGGGVGAISWFGERNPIFRNGTIGNNANGLGVRYDITDKVRFDVSYLAGNAQSPVATATPGAVETNGGLFGGTSSLLGQLSFKPYAGGEVAVTYIRNEAPGGNIQSGAGSLFAQNPFAGNAFSADSVGLQGTFRLAKQFAIGGWAGYTRANESGATNNAEIINAAVNLTVFDLIKEGSQLGLIAGLPPKNFNNDNVVREDPDTSIHLEGLFQFPVNNNIKITPGVIYIINPNHNDANDDVFAGVLRTTFSF
jgi:hypothetical protein